MGGDEQLYPLTACMCAETGPLLVLSGIKRVNFGESIPGNVYVKLLNLISTILLCKHYFLCSLLQDYV